MVEAYIALILDRQGGNYILGSRLKFPEIRSGIVITMLI